MSSSVPPPSSTPGDLDAGLSPSRPGPPSLPAATLWSDSDAMARPPAGSPGFGGLVASAADKAMPTIGHIGRYALKYQLGAGGLGTVFAAHDPLLSRLIAVKTLNLEIKDEERESFNAIFINEARAAGGLSHPHIVTVFDAGISDDRAYIAMELLKGRDLRQLMQEGWRATPAQAALIVRRVADALAYAHSKGVIHRDVKPANIFMVGRTQPRVLDFGIARITHHHERDANAGAGSPYYMAPEQVRRETTDRRADVFSLGVVLYELLTGTKPFTGDSLKTIADAVLQHEPPLASKVDAHVPRALAEIVARAMEKEPDKRFRSARSFARDLRQWLDANLEAPESEPLAPPPRRRRALAFALAGATFAAVAGIAGVSAWQALLPAAPLPAAPVAMAPLAAPAVRLPEPGPRPVAMAPAADGAASTAPPAVVSAASGLSASSASSTDAIVGAVSAAPIIPPVPAAVFAVPEPVTAKPAPTVVATTKEPVKESAKDRRAREARERDAREREARLAAPALPATGKVRIAISPWGNVEVDGAPSGAAPPLTELTLAEGRHQIVVRNGDFAPFTASVEVTAGQVVAVRHKFGS